MQEIRKQVDYTQQLANRKSNTEIQHMNIITGHSLLTHKMGTTSTELDFPIYPTILYFASHNYD
jgi:hypothetical protein